MKCLRREAVWFQSFRTRLFQGWGTVVGSKLNAFNRIGNPESERLMVAALNLWEASRLSFDRPFPGKPPNIPDRLSPFPKAVFSYCDTASAGRGRRGGGNWNSVPGDWDLLDRLPSIFHHTLQGGDIFRRHAGGNPMLLQAFEAFGGLVERRTYVFFAAVRQEGNDHALLQFHGLL